MALLLKLKHVANLKNNASEIKLNKRFIKPRMNMYHDQDIDQDIDRKEMIEPAIEKAICMKRLNAPNTMTPMKMPLSETPSPAN